VTREAMTLVAAGAIAGAGLAAAAGPIAAHYLYGVAPYDLRVVLASAGALVVIALIAASVPALRAARIDPFHALRTE